MNEACGLLGVSPQAWYKYHSKSFTEALSEDLIVELCRAIRMDLPGIGARKLKVLLWEEFNIVIGRDSLFDILERNGLLIRNRKRKARTTFSDHGLKVYPDLRKHLVPDGINQLWVSDITYIWLGGCFHYLFIITDTYSKKIVCWEIADSIRHENAERALKMALKQLKKGQCPVHHTDKSLQYCAKTYMAKLLRRKIRISITEG